jgi:hypothetical protein
MTKYSPISKETADVWWQELPSAVTLCSPDGTIIAMNNKAIRSFEADGGAALIGTNVLDCHPEPARTILREMLQHASPNVYTIEKNGVKKLIYQSPFFRDGVYAGFVEISIQLPDPVPHFVRSPG